jgi:hypothetical protein
MKNLTRKYFIIFILYCVYIFLSCDAPHNNPNDPSNPDKPLKTISGSIKALNLPNNPITNAAVYFEAENKLTYSDNSGNFNLDNLIGIDGSLIVSKDGFWSDTTKVVWGESKTLNFHVFLNQNPSLNTFQTYSVVTNISPSTQTQQVVIKADIFDAEKDIDTVYVWNDYLKKKQMLRYNMETGWYEIQLKTSDFKIKAVDVLVGRDFQLMVVDKFRHTFELGKSDIKRVIYDYVQVDSPVNSDTVKATPELKWQKFMPPFHCHYSVEIYAVNDIPPDKVWEQDSIPQEITSLKVDQALPSGDYFWVIWCIDDFFNRARSRTASFKVE